MQQSSKDQSVTRAKYRKLGTVKYIKLADLLRRSKESVERGDWSPTSFAEHATVQIGVSVNAMHVKRAADATEICFKSTRTGVALSTCRELRAAVIAISSYLAETAGERGKPVPPIIQEFAALGIYED